ncbi:MAG: ferredoxin, partial [Nanoarchaeota archaeon]|nr:ferredoxin [Nanoarchaeota archaeon]
IGCGTCEMMCPEAFKLVKGKVKVKNAKAKCIEKAVKACPVKAIILK